MLTDKQRKKIIADYIENNNYSEVARLNNCSVDTVRRLTKGNNEIVKKSNEKKNENTQEMLEEMTKRKQVKINLVDKIFDAMNGKLDNIDKFTSIKDLATAYGIIIDKELKFYELQLKKAEIELNKNQSSNVQRIEIINDLPEVD